MAHDRRARVPTYHTMRQHGSMSAMFTTAYAKASKWCETGSSNRLTAFCHIDENPLMALKQRCMLAELCSQHASNAHQTAAPAKGHEWYEIASKRHAPDDDTDNRIACCRAMRPSDRTLRLHGSTPAMLIRQHMPRAQNGTRQGPRRGRSSGRTLALCSTRHTPV